MAVDREAFLGPMSRATRALVERLLEVGGFELATHSIYPTESDEWAGGANIQVDVGEWWIFLVGDDDRVIYAKDEYNDWSCTPDQFVSMVRVRQRQRSGA